MSHGAAKSKAGIESDEIVIPLTALAPDPANARKMSDAARAGLGVSMATFGELGMVFNDRTGQWVSGHQRYERLLAAGAAECVRTGAEGYIEHPKTGERFRVRFVDWDETKQRMANLVANNPKISGEFTEDALAQLKELEDEAGFESLALDELEKELADELGIEEAAASGNCDPDDVPEPPAEPFSKRGDLWLLGEHRILCGDSTSAEDVARLMGGEKAVLMATDPPYGVDFAGAKYNPRAKEWAGILNDKMQGADLQKFISTMLSAWLSFMDPSSAFYFWTAAMQEGAAAAAAIRGAGLHIQSQIIWNKNCLVLGQADYHWKHENCWYAFWKGKQHRWFGERDKTTVWEVHKVANSEYVHPMQKPTELYAIPQRHHTVADEIVAEPFSGSGSQIIAAEQLGRRCFAMELDPRYVDVAVARWEKFTGKSAVKADAP